jgi:hypothetical protein
MGVDFGFKKVRKEKSFDMTDEIERWTLSELY